MQVILEVSLEVSPESDQVFLVKLNFSDEARKLARLLISRARLFFILVQKMDGKKELG